VAFTLKVVIPVHVPAGVTVRTSPRASALNVCGLGAEPAGVTSRMRLSPGASPTIVMVMASLVLWTGGSTMIANGIGAGVGRGDGVELGVAAAVGSGVDAGVRGGGACVGPAVGGSVGATVGRAVGAAVGGEVGTGVGAAVGREAGTGVGATVGVGVATGVGVAVSGVVVGSDADALVCGRLAAAACRVAVGEDVTSTCP